jgi:hypothetical protein
MPGRGRVGIYDRHNEVRAQRLAAMTPEQRALQREIDKRKKLLPVKCAPVLGDPEAIDWETHECGYVPRTDPNGKVLPKTREPAWQWTEEKGSSGKQCLRTAVKRLALEVYRVGYRHNSIELHNEGGFPDDTYWGRHGPKLIFRELKAMRPDWKRGQKQHLLSLREAGQNVAVWFPCCLLSGHIDEELAALAGVPPMGTYARRTRGVANHPLTWGDIADGALNDEVDSEA